jgi:hypothetical protein
LHILNFQYNWSDLLLGTGETLHMSPQEKSPLWIQFPKETSIVWIHGSRLAVPVPYYTQLKHTLPVPEIEVRFFFLPISFYLI